MSSTPQDPYGAGDEPDRSTGGTPSYGSNPPPPPAGDTPPPYGSGASSAGGTGGPSFGGPAYGSTPPVYGGADYGGGYGGGQAGLGYGYPSNNLAVWSLVLGLVGVFVCGLFAGIPAIVVGHKARRAVADGQANNPGMATAGIVLGWVATVLSLLGVLAFVALIATGSFAELQNVDPSSF